MSQSTHYEDLYNRRSLSKELDKIDEKSTRLHHELLDAAREAHERVYRAAEAERLRALELEARERRARIERPPDPLPPSPPPPEPPAPPAAPATVAREEQKQRPASAEAPPPENGFPNQMVQSTATQTTQAQLFTNENRKQAPLGPEPNQPSSAAASSMFQQNTEPIAATAPAPSPAVQLQPPAQPAPAQSGTRDQVEIENEHSKYVTIHQQLKTMRKQVMDLCKQDRELKLRLGDMRRDINTRVGQLSNDKAANRTPILKIINTLKDARRNPKPQIDYSQFMIEPRQSPYRDSAFFIYLLSIFSKRVIDQFAVEAGRDTKRAESIGIMVSTVFSEPDLQTNQQSMIDILLAKYHITCPVLFGINGDPKMQTGRRRLGWQRIDGEFIPENAHNERQLGLGAGYASLTLRNYMKSKKVNPYLPYHFWTAMARILNTPREKVVITHVCVLRGMLENYMVKFLEFYGRPAYVALRKALIEFPTKAPQGPATNSLYVLKDVLERDHRVTVR
ncbi:MAG: hypothetical protein M1820_007377 [Bogoriella megaspora]|nr:MAG: hypothetical protein M1820_007377 [Bogoriella megaspora]